MNTAQALQRLTDVIRRKHFALATEHSYRMWLSRYCDYIKPLTPSLSSEQKLERFLTALAKDNVAASTQNQAFDPTASFYKEVIGRRAAAPTWARTTHPRSVPIPPGRAGILLAANAAG